MLQGVKDQENIRALKLGGAHLHDELLRGRQRQALRHCFVQGLSLRRPWVLHIPAPATRLTQR